MAVEEAPTEQPPAEQPPTGLPLLLSLGCYSFCELTPEAPSVEVEGVVSTILIG